ncbi:MAG: sulfate adenylyltransferase [Deltaproteobacteria bacterium]|nr:MAG: sulfate adenylyltransferase [Deltaproteobacteria bacterium]
MTEPSDAILPHGGGPLVDRLADEATRDELRARHARGDLPTLQLNPREVSDLELLANGAFTPLVGFMGKDDYDSVVDRGRLANGVPWTIPITLSAPRARAEALPRHEPVGLVGPDGALLGSIEIAEVFAYDKAREARQVFGTEDTAHPAVAYLMGEMGDRLLGGPIALLDRPAPAFPRYGLDPRATRALFRERGWRRIVAFQTRNPIHRAHEYIIKCALEICDGLLIHPIVGFTKGDDIPADVRVRCYEAIIEHYFPADRVALATLPAAMRYAGPKEAIFHAIMRRNYGCTHFIVGRDHAGVGNYYGTYDAQAIFDEYDPAEIGITPLRFEHAFYCTRCSGMGTAKTCPHDADAHVFLSGTKVRAMLAKGERPPPEFSRPEVADILIAAYGS